MRIQTILASKAFLLLLLLVVVFAALALGRYPVQFGRVLHDLHELAVGNSSLASSSTDLKVILLRIPRIIMALLAGAALASAGAVYQGLFRNPLVSPDILGISSGACLGAALAILCQLQHPFVVQLFAFCFGIGAVLLAYQLACISKGHSIIMLVMSGIVISSFLRALLAFFKYVGDPYQHLPAIIFWMMGGLYNIDWPDIGIALPIVGLSLGVIFLLRRRLNVMSLGDEEATALGLNVKNTRLGFILTSTLAVAGTTCFTGIIGWVGLIVPHIARILVGPNHNRSIPWSMAIGGCFVLTIDTIARTATPQEIPIGIITALLGAPFFAYLLIFKQEKGWGRW